MSWSAFARAFAVLVAVCSPLATAHARQVVTTEEERDQRAAELKRYRAAIQAYRSGDNSTVKTILAWDTKRLEAIVATVDTPLDPTRPWTPQDLKAAAMLHTDAAMEHLYEDERRVGLELELASRLLHKAGREIHTFSREWYSAVTRSLRGVVLFTVAERFLENGRKRQPADAVLVYESGLLQEHIATFAAFFFQLEVPPFPAPRPGAALQSYAASSGRHPSLAEQRRALNNAVGWFRESLGLEASNELTQLHLGRVQMLRGDSDASSVLERLAGSSTDASTAYLATMFLAARDARNERHALAERRYRLALEKLPSAPSAYVGLSETLQKLGRGEESRDILRQLFVRSASAVNDPWWWYLSDPLDQPRRRLAALRASVRQ